MCSTATLKAPDSFSSYLWNGPAGFTSTNSVVTATLPGTYTLTLNQDGLCSAITKTINLNLTLSPLTGTILGGNNPICQGESVTLTVSGMTNCSWNTGDIGSSILVSPYVTSFYLVSGISPDGCSITTAFTQSVDACTGLREQTLEQKISLYPNPNNGEFVLSIDMGITKGELIIENLMGQIVLQQSIISGKNAIKTNNLPLGIYYYKVKNKNQDLTTGRIKIE